MCPAMRLVVVVRATMVQYDVYLTIRDACDLFVGGVPPAYPTCEFLPAHFVRQCVCEDSTSLHLINYM